MTFSKNIIREIVARSFYELFSFLRVVFVFTLLLFGDATNKKRSINEAKVINNGQWSCLNNKLFAIAAH